MYVIQPYCLIYLIDIILMLYCPLSSDHIIINANKIFPTGKQKSEQLAEHRVAFIVKQSQETQYFCHPG